MAWCVPGANLCPVGLLLPGAWRVAKNQPIDAAMIHVLLADATLSQLL
jgi:hypothetical protein